MLKCAWRQMPFPLDETKDMQKAAITSLALMGLCKKAFGSCTYAGFLTYNTASEPEQGKSESINTAWTKT